MFLIIELKFYKKFYKNVEILIFLHEYKIIRRTKSTIILKFNNVNIIEKKMAILNLLLKTRLNNFIEIRKTLNCYKFEDNNLHLTNLFQIPDK